MRPLVFALALLAPAAVHAQAKPGWGNVGKPEDTGFSWTRPLFEWLSLYLRAWSKHPSSLGCRVRRRHPFWSRALTRESTRGV